MSFGFYFALFIIIVLVILGFIFYQKLKDFMKDPLGLFSFVTDIGKSIGSGIGNLANGIGKGFGNFGKGVGKGFGDFGKGFGKGATKTGDDIVKGVSSF